MDKSLQLRNALIAGATIVLVIGLYGATSSDFSRVTPQDLVKRAVPYEVAQSNGKPTVLEFYADWCVTCKTMAPTIGKLEDRFRGQINLVMLNVDNPKWAPELDRYRVNGIPHYVFLDQQGEIKGNVIGEQSETIFAANMIALAQGEVSLPYAKPAPGQVSTFKDKESTTQLQPRDHSS